MWVWTSKHYVQCCSDSMCTSPAEAVLSAKKLRGGKTSVCACGKSGEPVLDDTPYKRPSALASAVSGRAGNASVRFGPKEVIEYSAQGWTNHKTSVEQPGQALHVDDALAAEASKRCGIVLFLDCAWSTSYGCHQ